LTQTLQASSIFVNPNELTNRKGILKLALFDGFAPFVYKEYGQIKGKDLEILAKFAQQEDLNVVYQFYPFEDIWKLPIEEDYDIACGGISKFWSRGAIWSESYMEVRRSGVILRSNKPYIKSYNDIRKIGVVTGSAAHVHAKKHMEKGIVIEVPNLDKGVEYLLDGHIEVLGTGSVSANHLKKKWEVLDVIDLHQPSSDYVEEIAFSVADNPLLLHKLNQFILSIKDYQI